MLVHKIFNTVAFAKGEKYRYGPIIVDLLQWTEIFISRFDVTVESISSLIYTRAIRNLAIITIVQILYLLIYSRIY